MIKLDININSKIYNHHLNVIENLNFNASPGEFIALVGPSGAGKTTLLKLVSGIDTEFDGEIKAGTGSVEQNGLLKIGYMFQQPSLMPWLTVLENLMLVLPTDNTVKQTQGETLDGKNRALAFIEQVGLSGFEHSFPNQLSGGMQKRVSMARAFAVDPELLLLDEPFLSLDTPTAVRLRQQLLAFWLEKKQTVLFVTHDLREAVLLADRILFLSNRPARVLLDYQVELDRSSERTSKNVNLLHDKLLNQHPQLLSGQLY